MCLLYTRIDGVKYNLQQMREMYERTCEENALLNDELAKREKQVADLSKQIAIHQKEANDKQNEIDTLRKEIANLKEQLADFPTRDKNGRFKKR